jgi:spermidine synthase
LQPAAYVEAKSSGVRLFSLIFFLSGATSLVYQVAWMRKLSLFFGSDVYSAAVTLAAFMAGLCIGSWLSGKLTRKVRRPLFAYGVVEAAIAGYALVFSAILQFLDPSLTTVYRDTFVAHPSLYQLSRAAIAFLALLPPTALMGATLPLVMQHFAVADRLLGRRLGHFYAMNTMGAFAGTLLAGFAVLPLLGIWRSIALAAGVNVAIAVAAIALAMRSESIEIELSSAFRAPKHRPRSLAILTIGISGFAALALEVVWMRILVVSFSATVYAFSIMLACFLAGIFMGSEREAGRVDALRRPAERLIRLELALFAYTALLAILTYVAPGFFGTLLWGLTAVTGGFGISSVVAQAIAASLLIMWPTLWLGATFPLAVKVYSNDIQRRAADTGIAYSANTLGALGGALSAGFLLIPLLGTRNSLFAIAVLFLVAATVLNPLSEQPTEAKDRALRLSATIAGIILIIIGVALPRQILANFNMQQNPHPDLIYHGEGVAHTVDIIRTPTNNTLMMVDGNVEADTTLLQMRHFILKAHLPLLLNRDPKDVAVIGLGLGVTLAATARNPAVDRIRLIELSPEMVEAQRYLRSLTGDALNNPKVHLLIDDGRNFLNRSTEQFDMITADPIHPRITGVGYLYTSEYYKAVRAHLKPGGYILQWMPMYAISRKSFDVAFRTFAGMFPQASFWYVRSHGLFVAGLDPLTIDFATVSKRFDYPAVRRDFESIGVGSPHQLLAHLLMDEEHIAQYLRASAVSGSGINTDDNSNLEYATPFEFLQSTKPIIQALMPFTGFDRNRIVGADPADLAEIDWRYAARRSELISELDRPIQ